MRASRFILLTAALAVAAFGAPGTASATDLGVPIHCVATGVPTSDFALVAPATPADDVADLLGAGTVDFCVHDEALAETLGGTGRTKLAKYWTEDNFQGASVLYSVPASAAPNGCHGGGVLNIGEFPDAFNNNIESAKGFNGCTFLKFWNYRHFRGGTWSCNSPCDTLGSNNNRASSGKARRP
jgi:hypothetical protein